MLDLERRSRRGHRRMGMRQDASPMNFGGGIEAVEGGSRRQFGSDVAVDMDLMLARA